jgi:hypothetical protein
MIKLYERKQVFSPLKQPVTGQLQLRDWLLLERGSKIMTQLMVHSERLLSAPADLVDHLFADFVNHHPRFLPPQFTQVQVLKGGYGAGTGYTFTSLFGGNARGFRMRVSEPEPGRVLVENDTRSPLVTTITVNPQGVGSRVILETVWESSGGLMGLLESWFAPGMMRRMYEDEFNRLERYAQEQIRFGTSGITA